MIIYLCCGGSENSFKDVDEYLRTQFVANKVHLNSKTLGGLYLIYDANIILNFLTPSEKPYKAYVSEWNIMNDTTFTIKKIYKLVDGSKTEFSTINETYHFRQFSPKPDSTNTFIK